MKLPEIIKILNSSDEEGRKDRESVREFILTLADTLQKYPGYSNYTEEILQIASYSSDASASGKALLEYLSLLLPVLPQGRT